MDQPTFPAAKLDVDVDLGFAIFFFISLCLFLCLFIVRCAQLVLDPYSAVSVSMYQEEQSGDWRRAGRHGLYKWKKKYFFQIEQWHKWRKLTLSSVWGLLCKLAFFSWV